MLCRTVDSDAIVPMLLNENEKGAEGNIASGTAMVSDIAIVIVIDVGEEVGQSPAEIPEGAANYIRT